MTTSSAPAAATTSRARSPRDYVVDNKLGEQVAIVHDQTAYGKGLADEFKKQLNKRGVKEVMYEAISQGDKDFSALITKMKRPAST